MAETLSVARQRGAQAQAGLAALTAQDEHAHACLSALAAAIADATASAGLPLLPPRVRPRASAMRVLPAKRAPSTCVSEMAKTRRGCRCFARGALRAEGRRAGEDGDHVDADRVALPCRTMLTRRAASVRQPRRFGSSSSSSQPRGRRAHQSQAANATRPSAPPPKRHPAQLCTRSTALQQPHPHQSMPIARKTGAKQNGLPPAWHSQVGNAHEQPDLLRACARTVKLAVCNRAHRCRFLSTLMF
eukprot:365811-Chlamydomonas_euryale.AAC.18